MIEKRFIYRGNGVPFAGEVTRIDPVPRVEHLVDDDASSALSVIGGLSTGQGREFVHRVEEPRSLVLFQAKEYGSKATGQMLSAGSYQTSVMSFVRGAAIIERITVDAVAAHLTSVHSLTDKFPSIAPHEGTFIEGFRLDGVEVQVELDLSLIQKNPTKAAFKRAAKSCFKGGAAPEAKGVIFTTIVKKMKFVGTPPEGATIRGNSIIWKNVGRLYVGEVLISDYYRRLTMLRAQLGSPIEGAFAVGDAEANGMTVP